MQAQTPRLMARSVTDLIDATFSLYRHNIVLFAGVCAIAAVPQAVVAMAITALVQGASAPSTTFSDTGSGSYPSAFLSTWGSFYAASGLVSLASILFTVLMMGALSTAVAARYLDRPISIPQAYSNAGWAGYLRLFLSLLVGAVGATIAIGGAIALTALLAALLGTVSTALAIIVAVLAAIGVLVLTVYIGLHFLFVVPVIVIERSGVFRAFGRSWRLVHGAWLRTLGFVVLLGLIAGFVFWFVVLLASALSFGNAVIAAGLSSILGILTQPLQYGGINLLYFDQRVRKEGFDLEYAAMRAHEQTPA